ncbi:hypothetical protein Hanom_Chr04g00368501 [Helianthus anomalus]
MVRSTERYINSGYLTHSFFILILTHTFKVSNTLFTSSNSGKLIFFLFCFNLLGLHSNEISDEYHTFRVVCMLSKLCSKRSN